MAGKGHVAVTNGDIRDKRGLSTIESLLRYRRLRWWQSMLKDPGRHNLYLASVLGRFDWETTDDFNEEGVPTNEALAVIRQLHEDIRTALPDFEGFSEGWQKKVLELEPQILFRFACEGWSLLTRVSTCIS